MREEATDTWYEDLREEYRPERLEVLLIAESPPDPGDGRRRFFYAPDLGPDNLFRGMAEALYGDESGFDVRRKTELLRRMQDDGFWLIDAVDHPVNKLSSGERRAALRAAVPGLLRRCRGLQPARGVIICHGAVYEAAAPALREAGVRVLHDEPIPFPLGNWRGRFVDGVREALGSAHSSPASEEER